MGRGYSFVCKKCKHKYSVFPGIGMMYPMVYRELLQKIEEGVYGEPWQQLVRETRYVAVDAANQVYVCRACATWEESKDITLYAPNDPEKIAKERFGEKTVDEWGYVPYVTSFNEYHVLKRYYKKCSKCGKRMHKADRDEIQCLPCPKCGIKNEADKDVMWD